jgi:serine/threonine protein phosphatase PrpC
MPRKGKINKTVKLSREKQQGVKLFVNENTCITVKIGNCSHQGARDYQEDSFGYSNIVDSKTISEKGFLAVLADGMGGLANGRAISDYVVSSFIKMFNALNYSSPFPSQLESIVMKINEEVCRNFTVDGKSGAGSTIAAAFVYRAKLYWVCVGDSRLYVLRNKRLYAANEDHDYFNQLLPEHLADEISMKQIKSDEKKDSLASYIGNEKLPYIDVNRKGFPLRKGDMIILCSDGVYNGISGEELTALLKQYEPQRASEKITQAILNKNIAGQDNLTVMVIKLED